MLNKIADYSERLFLVLLSATFLHAVLSRATEHPYLLLLAASETLPVLLIIVRRPGEMVMKPFPWLLALVGTAAPLMVRPTTGGMELLSEGYAGLLMTCGVGLNLAAKISLWRSFGLAPANRGIRGGGPYRLIRHPMYLGYFLTQLGFLLANLSVGNIIKYLITWTVQLLRIREEEKFLFKDEGYRALARRVRFRLVPGIY